MNYPLLHSAVFMLISWNYKE